MTDSKLKQSLQHLQDEIEKLGSVSAADKQQLEHIVRNIERTLDPDDETTGDDLEATLSASIARFEVSHPRLTGVLNDIMVTLSNLGI